MTAYVQISQGKPRIRGNRKDGQGQPPTGGKDYTRANKWTQCWGPGLPRFEVGAEPRRTDQGLKTMIVARCTMAGVEKTWPATADFSIIRSEVDDLILEIMRHDAKLADGPLWDIDIDEFMEVTTNA